MKTEIIKDTPEVKEIDWSKPQLVKNYDNGHIVITTGEHTEFTFNGIDFNDVEYRVAFTKSYYSPITEPITIKFMPE